MVAGNLQEGLEYNAWESSFFGKRTYRLHPSLLHTFGDVSLPADWEIIECIVPLARLDWVGGASAAGFLPVDVHAHFGMQVAPVVDEQELGGISAASEADIAALRILAADALVGGRFANPPFTPEDAARLYAQWVENAVKKQFDHICLVERLPQTSAPAGVLTLRFVDQNRCRIGLLATSGAARRMGVGGRLIRAASRCARENHRNELVVTTRLATPDAMRLYEREGFRFESASLHFFRTRVA